MKRIGDRVKVGGCYGKIVDHSEPLVFTIAINCTAGNPDGERITVPGYQVTKMISHE